MIIYYSFLSLLSPATAHLLICQALNPDTNVFGFIFSVAKGRVVNLQKLRTIPHLLFGEEAAGILLY